MSNFLLSVLEDVLANIVTLLLGAGVFSLWVFFRFSSFEQQFRKWIHPNNRVLVLPQTITGEVIPQATPFSNPLEPYERGQVVQFYCRRAKADPYNGKVVRLDSLKPCKVSTVDFFDFLSTNLIVFPAYASPHSFSSQLRIAWNLIRVYPLIHKVFSAIGRPSTIDEVLSHTHLANIIAVSVLLTDSTGRVGVVNRSNQVAISPGQFTTSSTGMMKESDLDSKDPFLACALRGIYEELNLELSSLNFDGLVMPRQKMQPILLYSAQLSKTWGELWPIIRHARDFHRENHHFYAIPPDKIMNFIATRNFTDTAAHQLFQYVNFKFPQQRYWKYLFRFARFPIKNYQLDR